MRGGKTAGERILDVVIVLAMLFSVLTVAGAIWVYADDKPVDMLTQCHAYVGILMKQRDAAMADLATHAARLEQVSKEKGALEAKVKELTQPRKETR